MRIMIVDDHEVVRLGLSNLLARQPGWQVVAEAGALAEVIRLADWAYRIGLRLRLTPSGTILRII